MKKYSSELKEFETKKGTIHFTAEKPLPADLVKKIVKDRVKENEDAKTIKKIFKMI